MNSPAEILNAYSEAGSKKAALPFGKLFMLSIFAGAFIAFGGLASSIVSCGMQPAALGRFLGAVVFPVGLAMVLIAGSELFTGNCMIIISVMDKKANVWGFVRNLLIVYAGNFVGGTFIAALACYGHVFDLYNGALANATVATAAAKCNLSFTDAFFKGILCNIMVCIAVWMSFAESTVPGKIIASYLPVVLFVIGGFEHCVANFYFIPAGLFASGEYGIAAEGLNWTRFFLVNEIPVTLGNIVGGSVCVGLGYWCIYRNKKSNTEAK